MIALGRHLKHAPNDLGEEVIRVKMTRWLRAIWWQEGNLGALLKSRVCASRVLVHTLDWISVLAGGATEVAALARRDSCPCGTHND